VSATLTFDEAAAMQRAADLAARLVDKFEPHPTHVEQVLAGAKTVELICADMQYTDAQRVKLCAAVADARRTVVPPVDDLPTVAATAAPDAPTASRDALAAELEQSDEDLQALLRVVGSVERERTGLGERDTSTQDDAIYALTRLIRGRRAQLVEKAAAMLPAPIDPDDLRHAVAFVRYGKALAAAQSHKAEDAAYFDLVTAWPLVQTWPVYSLPREIECAASYLAGHGLDDDGLPL